jgi:hypothetical protein
MKHVLFSLSILILLTGILNANDLIDVSIRFQDKKLYYADSPDQDVNILVTLTNKGTVTSRFKIADERAFSVDFSVSRMDNRLIDSNDALNRLDLHINLYISEKSLSLLKNLFLLLRILKIIF